MTVRVMGGEAVHEALPEPAAASDKPAVYIPPESGMTRTVPRVSGKRGWGYGRALAVRFFIAAGLFAAIYFGKTFGTGEVAELCGKIAVLFG